jgi:Hydroxymethylglutaryl-coenzyme A reductase
LPAPSIRRIPRDSLDGRIALVRELLSSTPERVEAIRTSVTEEDVRNKIENFVGAVPIPLGLCGPIDIAGRHASGSFVVPMATLEGALVASYSRGAKVVNQSGGCETFVYGDEFLRAGQFITSSLERSAALIDWCKSHEAEIREQFAKSSAHASLVNLSYDCVGSTVVVSIGLTTGDAMGSNIDSKAAGLVCGYIVGESGLVDDAIIPYPEDKKYIPRRQKGKTVIARWRGQRVPIPDRNGAASDSRGLSPIPDRRGPHRRRHCGRLGGLDRACRRRSSIRSVSSPATAGASARWPASGSGDTRPGPLRRAASDRAQPRQSQARRRPAEGAGELKRRSLESRCT